MVTEFSAYDIPVGIFSLQLLLNKYRVIQTCLNFQVSKLMILNIVEVVIFPVFMETYSYLIL